MSRRGPREGFTLADLHPWISPFLVDGSGEEDRFLVSVQGAHAGGADGIWQALRDPGPYQLRSSSRRRSSPVAERADPALSGAEADFDGDGTINVLEHVFASDPRQPSHGMVGITRAAGAAPVGPQVTFPWNPGADYAYQLQMSPDLHRFHDIPFTQNHRQPTAAGCKSVWSRTWAPEARKTPHFSGSRIRPQ